MKRRLRISIRILASIVAATIAALLLRNISEGGRFHRLNDGSTVELQESVFTSDNVQFPISEGSRWARFLSPILPGSLRQRFGVAVVNNFVFKGSGTTNLFLLTETRAPANSIAPKLGRLKVLDAAGEEYEAAGGWSLATTCRPGCSTPGRCRHFLDVDEN